MSREITAKILRLRQILLRLEQGAVRQEELADELQVSTRTIQRDMALMQQAQFPLLGPKQGVYRLAEGFSLMDADLTAEKVSVWLVSYDLAKQLGEDFLPLLRQIRRWFLPRSFTDCIFWPDAAQIQALGSLAQGLHEAAQSHYIVRMTLHTPRRNLTVRPYRLICLRGWWYLTGTNLQGELFHYPLQEIESFSLRGVEGVFSAGKSWHTLRATSARTFTPAPFLHWKIWKHAHYWMGEIAHTAAPV